jgi:hypothetical protein
MVDLMVGVTTVDLSANRELRFVPHQSMASEIRQGLASCSNDSKQGWVVIDCIVASMVFCNDAHLTEKTSAAAKTLAAP